MTEVLNRHEKGRVKGGEEGKKKKKKKNFFLKRKSRN